MPRKPLANPDWIEPLISMGIEGTSSARSGLQPVWKQDERVAVRLNVRMKARLREPQSTRFEVDVFDISVTGCRVETSAVLNVGARIFITVPGIAPLEATVAWRDHFRYGCAFNHPLHNAVLDHIANKHRKT